jgi:hypothetical protein
MGTSTILNAPKCGSGAHRPTHLWQNFVTNSTLENAYNTLINTPRTVDDILATNGLGAWSTTDTTAGETSARLHITLPRFGTKTATGPINHHNAAYQLVHTAIRNATKGGGALYSAKDIFIAAADASSLPQTTTEDEESIIAPYTPQESDHQHVFLNTTNN